MVYLMNGKRIERDYVIYEKLKIPFHQTGTDVNNRMLEMLFGKPNDFHLPCFVTEAMSVKEIGNFSNYFLISGEINNLRMRSYCVVFRFIGCINFSTGYWKNRCVHL